MDITQILITGGAILGIVVVALLAVVPTVMEIPAPDRTRTAARRSSGHHRHPHHHPDRRTTTVPAGRDDDFHLAA